MKNLKLLFTLCAMVIASVCNLAYGAKGGDFALFKGGQVAQIYVSKSEPIQIQRAVKDLKNDIKMVTGVEPQVVNSLDDLSRNSIIVGSVDNAQIKSLIASKKIAEAEQAKGKYESFLLKTVDGVTSKSEESLMVVGSDALGAVYGIYEISERIGVSPAYWWCDIPVKRQNEVILKDVYELPKEPSVRYRGVFINDEEAMIQWSRLTSKQRDKGHISPEIYKHVFEYLLRNRANTLWPGMIETGSFFFKYRDEQGIAINPKNATEYGIYVGASHCEQMGRNNYYEWYDWAAEHKGMYDAKGEPEWDYSVNPKAIEAYWTEIVKDAKVFNMIYTLGIRGVHDTPFFARKLKDQTLKSKVELVQHVIDRQREIIKEVYGSADAVPQVFVPYEETGEIYNGESVDGKEKCAPMKLPEDVIVVYTEDNHGFARQFATAKERQRKGGLGIYYHFCYQGSPAQYNWLSTTPFILQREEYNKIYSGGAQKFWIVNVGDLKPSEFNQRYFFKYTNDVEKYSKLSTREFAAENSELLFNISSDKATDVADILTNFYQFSSAMRPEFLVPMGAAENWGINRAGQGNWGSMFPTFQYYSLFDFGDEAQGRIEFIKALEARAKKIYDSLDESYKPSFYHLVYYPVRSARLMYEKTIYYRKNRLYAEQGRLGSVNAYKALAEQAEELIQKDLHYYNKVLAGGKWNGIMDPYAHYNIVERVFDISQINNTFTYDSRYLEQQKKGIGAVCEGQVKGDESVTLRFSSLENNSRFIDIFNKEAKQTRWSVSSDKAFVKFSLNSGVLDAEQRLFATIDWAAANVGDNSATITVKDAEGNEVKSFKVKATKIGFKPEKRSYVEGCGFVVIEAEHFTASKRGKDGASWSESVDYGHVGSCMFSRNSAKITKNIEASSPVLEYEVYFESTGTFYGNLYRIPTLNEGKGKSCEVGLGVDDNAAQILAGVRIKSQRHTVVMSDKSREAYMWHRNVMAQMEKMPFKINIDKKGYHTIKLYGVDANIGVDRIVICTSKQAEVEHRRSLVSAPISYNTIVAPNRVAPAQLPTLSSEDTAVTPYPTLTSLLYSKFLFSHYAMPAMFGFTPVNQSHVFNPNTTLFGWDAKDVKFIKSGHNESTRKYMFWNRDSNFGNKPATFYSRFMKGKYRVTMHYGNMMNYNVFKPGDDLKMTIKINGNTILDNVYVKESNPKSTTVDVVVDNDEMMIFNFSGKWSISMVEIYRY